VLLVGTKVDLRNDADAIENLKEKNMSPIQAEAGDQLCSEIKAIKYMECSALTMEGLKEVFDFAIKAKILGGDRKPKKGRRGGGCVLL